MYVCYCVGLNEKKIKEIIQSGIKNIEEIAKACRAGTGCGHCLEDIEKMITEVQLDLHLEEVRKIASKVKYRDWTLRVERDNAIEGGRVFLQWIYFDTCVSTGEFKSWNSRKWYLSPHMIESEIVKTAFGAALFAEEHEVREHFEYDGVRIFNPHISLEALKIAASSEVTRQNPDNEKVVS